MKNREREHEWSSLFNIVTFPLVAMCYDRVQGRISDLDHSHNHQTANATANYL
jgi:hypothetical protein